MDENLCWAKQIFIEPIMSNVYINECPIFTGLLKENKWWSLERLAHEKNLYGILGRLFNSKIIVKISNSTQLWVASVKSSRNMNDIDGVR